MEYPVCVNPHCKSYGKSHPNCHCSAYNEAAAASFAGGGCVGAHSEDCEHFADGGTVQANNEFAQEPELAIEHAMVHNGLARTMSHTGITRSADPTRPMQDLIEHAKKGRVQTKNEVADSFKKSKVSIEKPDVDNLKSHLQSIQDNPAQMINIGGDLAQTLPQHAVNLAMKSSTAVSYLQSIKPMGQQAGPYDKVTKPSKQDEAQYERQLQLAEHPLSILPRVKQGRVSPQDLTTLHTIYPQLSNSLKSHAFEQMLEAKQMGKAIPYKHLMGLSALLGQPLDSTMTPGAMQAIIKSAAGAQSQQQPKTKVATAQTQKTIEKSDNLSATDLQARQVDSKTK